MKEDSLGAKRLKRHSSRGESLTFIFIYFATRLSRHCKGNRRRLSRRVIVSNDRGDPSSFGGRFPISLNVNARDRLLMPFTNSPCARWSSFCEQLFAQRQSTKTIDSREDHCKSKCVILAKFLFLHFYNYKFLQFFLHVSYIVLTFRLPYLLPSSQVE